MSGETERELRREFAAVRSLRPDIQNPAMSLSVRKAPSDSVSLQTWDEIAERTIKGLGLQGCPFLVVQHRDKDDHIHIIASRIRLDGKAISDPQSYQKVEQVMREVEVNYGFERVQGSREAHDRALTWWEHKLLQEKGTLSPKLAMQARISAVLEDRPTTTQFINRLREAHDIEAIFKLGEGEVPCGVAFRHGDGTPVCPQLNAVVFRPGDARRQLAPILCQPAHTPFVEVRFAAREVTLAGQLAQFAPAQSLQRRVRHAHHL
jgi:Relaxase/Mobilisation nuclease domain